MTQHGIDGDDDSTSDGGDAGAAARGTPPAAAPSVDREPSRAQQVRHLLPRWPADWVVAGLLAIGLVGFLFVGDAEDASAWWLAPGALAALVQKVNGHWAAWRSEGVERAYVLESSALCFYLLTAFLVGGGILQSLGVVGHVNLAYGAIAALFLDSIVRDWAKNRYV